MLRSYKQSYIARLCNAKRLKGSKNQATSPIVLKKSRNEGLAKPFFFIDFAIDFKYESVSTKLVKN